MEFGRQEPPHQRPPKRSDALDRRFPFTIPLGIRPDDDRLPPQDINDVEFDLLGRLLVCAVVACVCLGVVLGALAVVVDEFDEGAVGEEDGGVEEENAEGGGCFHGVAGVVSTRVSCKVKSGKRTNDLSRGPLSTNDQGR